MSNQWLCECDGEGRTTYQNDLMIHSPVLKAPAQKCNTWLRGSVEATLNATESLRKFHKTFLVFLASSRNDRYFVTETPSVNHRTHGTRQASVDMNAALQVLRIKHLIVCSSAAARAESREGVKVDIFQVTKKDVQVASKCRLTV